MTEYLETTIQIILQKTLIFFYVVLTDVICYGFIYQRWIKGHKKVPFFFHWLFYGFTLNGHTALPVYRTFMFSLKMFLLYRFYFDLVGYGLSFWLLIVQFASMVIAYWLMTQEFMYYPINDGGLQGMKKMQEENQDTFWLSGSDRWYFAGKFFFKKIYYPATQNEQAWTDYGFRYEKFRNLAIAGGLTMLISSFIH